MSLLSFNSLLCWQITLTLLHVSWMGLVIGLIAAFANRVLRNSAANRRYRLNFASLLVFAASLPVMFVVVRGATAEFPANPIAVKTPVAKLADLTPPVVEESALALPATDAADFAPTSPQVSPSGEVISAAIPSPTILPEPPSAWQRASSVGHTAAPFIAIVYALGVALMFVKLAFGVRVSRRLRSASQPITDTTILARMATQAKVLWRIRKPTSEHYGTATIQFQLSATFMISTASP